VTRHPWPYAVGGVLLLLALAVPATALRAGIPDDGTRPPDRTERQAYDLVAEGFGPGVNGPLVVAVDVSRDATALGPLRRAIGADRGIASVERPSVNLAAGVATLVAYPTTGPQDATTYETIRRLRADVFPAALAGSRATAHIGGQTASFADLGDRVADRLPRFVLAVVLMSFVLLALVFRSVAVPVKAALLNLLSIGASLGVVVAVFQWGWAAGLIGLESTLPIVSFIPLFMFAIVFGLSMDYEVFLLSRIKEEYDVSGGNRESVVRGLVGTARVITSAALIMVSVFLGFVLDPDPTTKMFGLGLATAIFVDATVVRMVLVPAVMTLLGDANWWAPRGLRSRRIAVVPLPRSSTVEPVVDDAPVLTGEIAKRLAPR
jgi:RND superfamily putative drug exporter